MIESAGLVVYRGTSDQMAVLLVHPSGNYNRAAPWGIPKGLPDTDEPLDIAAVRETREETGVVVAGDLGQMLQPLGFVEYRRSRKRIHAFAARAGRHQPRAASWEVDRAEFLPIAEARRRIHPDQLPLLDRLVGYLAMGGDRAD